MKEKNFYNKKKLFAIRIVSNNKIEKKIPRSSISSTYILVKLMLKTAWGKQTVKIKLKSKYFLDIFC